MSQTMSVLLTQKAGEKDVKIGKTGDEQHGHKRLANRAQIRWSWLKVTGKISNRARFHHSETSTWLHR